jgi:hypothetical protein
MSGTDEPEVRAFTDPFSRLDRGRHTGVTRLQSTAVADNVPRASLIRANWQF